VETFSTRGLPVAKKLAFWNAIACDTFAAMDVRPQDAEQFYGSLDRERVGSLTVMNVYSSAVRIRHTREHIARMPAPSYLLLVPLQREMELTAEGAESIRVRAGEFCLIDHARTYEIAHGDSVRTLCIDFPRNRLEERARAAASMVGRLIQPDCAMSRMLLGLLRNLGDEVGRSAVAGIPPVIEDSLLSFIAATYASYTEPLVPRGRKARAQMYRAYIESRLTDPELKPREVASHFGVSERYIRALLSVEGETFSAFLWSLRLQRCARLLVDPAAGHLTITEIAFQSGFSSATHFGQSFKQRYGLTPREYRVRER
jgi:AraC-like DNA-binding protein